MFPSGPVIKCLSMFFGKGMASAFCFTTRTVQLACHKISANALLFVTLNNTRSRDCLRSYYFLTRMRGVNRRTDWRILKIFLPGFRIADSSIFFARISDSGQKLKGRFAYPYLTPLKVKMQNFMR